MKVLCSGPHRRGYAAACSAVHVQNRFLFHFSSFCLEATVFCFMPSLARGPIFASYNSLIICSGERGRGGERRGRGGFIQEFLNSLLPQEEAEKGRTPATAPHGA